MRFKRIQRKRTQGWRMPDNTVYVGRPTIFGNPFVLTACDRAEAVSEYRAYLTAHPLLILKLRNELRGKDLACWCPLDQPCHADVLLELANGSDEA